jgi:hypothetical protein
VSVSVSPIHDRTGRLIGASSIARDITERREVEAARHKRDIVRSVASLATAAAHEINNALSILLVHLELLAKDVSASGRRRIDGSLEATRQIHDIVGHLKHIRRIAFVDSEPNFDNMLDIRKSSAPDAPEGRSPEREKGKHAGGPF